MFSLKIKFIYMNDVYQNVIERGHGKINCVALYDYIWSDNFVDQNSGQRCENSKVLSKSS